MPRGVSHSFASRSRRRQHHATHVTQNQCHAGACTYFQRIFSNLARSIRVRSFYEVTKTRRQLAIHTRSILHCKHNHDALSCLSRPRSFAARICSELSCWEWQLRLRTVSAYPESPIRYVGASQSHPSLLNTIIDSTLLFVDPTRTVATRTFVWQRVRATTWKPTVAKLLSRALVFKSKCRQCDCVAPVSTKSVSLTNGRTLEFFV